MTETINSTKEAASTLFLGHNGEWWDFSLIVAGILVSLAAIAAVVATAGSIVAHKREASAVEQELVRYKLETSQKIAESAAVGESAKAETARANQRIATLNNETARLQADNLSLQKITQPRRMQPLAWTNHPEKIPALYERLKKFAGTKVFIQVVPDFEAQMFADDISNVLKASGWEVEYVGEERSHLSEKRFREGIAIITLMDGTPMSEAGMILNGVLSDLNHDMMPTGLAIPQPFKAGYPYFDPPIKCIFIRVGMKPVTTETLRIQRRQLERDRQEFMDSLKESLRRGNSASSTLPDGSPVEIILGPDDKLYLKGPTGNIEYTGPPPPQLYIPISPGSGGPFLLEMPLGQGSPKP